MENKNSFRNFYFVIIFSVAFGLIESAVVVYLRDLYFPDGFNFPLKFFTPSLFYIEILRELSTLIVIAAVAHLAGWDFYSRFAYFLLTFGTWDIFYYVWLKIFLNWPESLLTWDVLFLIPITWTAPVLAPIFCSLLMIIFCAMILYLQNQKFSVKFKYYEWILLISGSIIIIFSFIYDFLKLIINYDLLNKIDKFSTNIELQKIITSYVPTRFMWEIFIVGIFLIIIAMILIYQNVKKKIKLS